MIPCDICGKSGHSWFQCPDRSKKPDGWKPARLQKKMVDDFVVFGTTASVDGEHIRVEDIPVPAPPYPKKQVYGGGRKAGKTIAQLANVTPIVAMDFATPTGETMHIEYLPPSATQAELLKQIEDGRQLIADMFSVSPVKRGRGRPASIEDMKAYKAAKQREYRKRRAAQKEAKP